MRKKKENIFYLSKLYNWTILLEEGVGVAILNGCCHNNLECRKICYSAVEEKKIVQCLIVPEIDWIFRDVNFRNMKGMMLIE